MADYGIVFMVSWSLCQAYLQEVDMTQISGDHDFFDFFGNMTNFKVDSTIDSRIDKHHQVVLSNW